MDYGIRESSRFIKGQEIYTDEVVTRSDGTTYKVIDRNSPREPFYYIVKSKTLLNRQEFNSYDDALNFLKNHFKSADKQKKVSVKLEVFHYTAGEHKGKIFIGKKVGSLANVIELKSGFKTTKEAQQYLKDNEG